MRYTYDDITSRVNFNIYYANIVEVILDELESSMVRSDGYKDYVYLGDNEKLNNFISSVTEWSRGILQRAVSLKQNVKIKVWTKLIWVELCIRHGEPCIGIYTTRDSGADFYIHTDYIDYNKKETGYDQDWMTDVLVGLNLLRKDMTTVSDSLGSLLSRVLTSDENDAYKLFESSFKVLQTSFEDVVSKSREKGYSDTAILNGIMRSLKGVTWEE